MYRTIHSFLTLALEGLKSQFHVQATLPSGKKPPVCTEQETRRIPELSWTLWRRKIFISLVKIRNTFPRTRFLGHVSSDTQLVGQSPHGWHYHVTYCNKHFAF
jgi:hypothetical protein